MANSKRLIERTSSSLNRTEQELLEFRAQRDELNRQLRNARARADRKLKSTAYPDKLAKSALQTAKKEAPNILREAIDSATYSSTEFSKEPYRKMLYSAADDESIYKLIPRGSGWSTTLTVQIIFEQSAGTLNDYARGIEEYRTETLRTKPGDGRKATEWWLQNVWGNPGLFSKTIKGRVKASGRKAPFWSLLNSGSVPLASDRPDGSFNPISQTPTGFIDRAENSIRSEFLQVILPEQLKWTQELQDLNRFIDETIKMRDRVSDNVRQLGIDKNQNERVFASFDELQKFVDSNRVDDAMRRYRAGEEFERVLVSAKGSKRRVYLTARRLEGLID